MLDEPPFANVCFWYIPPSLQGAQHDEDYEDKLHKVSTVKFFILTISDDILFFSPDCSKDQRTHDKKGQHDDYVSTVEELA